MARSPKSPIATKKVMQHKFNIKHMSNDATVNVRKVDEVIGRGSVCRRLCAGDTWPFH